MPEHSLRGSSSSSGSGSTADRMVPSGGSGLDANAEGADAFRAVALALSSGRNLQSNEALAVPLANGPLATGVVDLGSIPPTELGPLVKWLHAKGAESQLINLPEGSGIVHIIRAMEDALFGVGDAEAADRCKRSSLLDRARELKRTLLGE